MVWFMVRWAAARLGVERPVKARCGKACGMARLAVVRHGEAGQGSARLVVSPWCGFRQGTFGPGSVGHGGAR